MECHEVPVPSLSGRQRTVYRSNSLQPELVLQTSSSYSPRHKSRNPGRSLTEIYTVKTRARASSSDPSFSLRRRTLTALTPLPQSSASQEKKVKFLNRSFSEMSWSYLCDDSDSVSSYNHMKDDSVEKEDAYLVNENESSVLSKANESFLSSVANEEDYEIAHEKADVNTSILWVVVRNCFKVLFWLIALILILALIILLFSTYFTYMKTQCDLRRKLRLPLKELDRQLSESVIGQKIAINAIITSLKDLENSKATSPVVMWMVGWTGSGKTHSTNILKNVLSNTSQIFTVIPSFYPQNDIILLKQKVKELYDRLHPCFSNFVVIDGWDENNLPFEILEQLLALFRIGLYQQKELGKTVIILSGIQGSHSINKEYLKLHRSGRGRGSFQVDDFRSVTESEAHGRKILQTVKSYVFVPFLPMEINQVRMCILEELSRINKKGILPKGYDYEKILERVIGQLDFIPASYPLLAVSGCKRVEALLRLSLSKDNDIL